MTQIISKLLAALLLTAAVATNSMAQSASPNAVVEDFVKAWNSHDLKAFDRLFSEDVIWVAVADSRVEGHANVMKDFTEIHATWAKTTTIHSSAVKVQQLQPDVASILYHVKFLEDGKEIPGIDRAVLLVVVKGRDGWKIATGQLTKQHEGA